MQYGLNIHAFLLDVGVWRANLLLVSLEEQDLLAVADELQLVGHKDNDFVLEVTLNALCEDLARDLWIDGAQRIVQQVNISISIDGPCEADSCLLAARNVDATLSNHGVLALGEVLHIFVELADLDSLVEALSVIVLAKADIVADSG